MIRPTFKREKALFADGATVVVGCDEVGRGCLAGPVVAAAVVMPRELKKGWKTLVRDSKALSALQRERAAEFIREHAVAFAVGEVDAATIDHVNIHHASLEAMRRAVENVRHPRGGGDPATALDSHFRGNNKTTVILVDGKFTIQDLTPSVRQRSIIHGDAVCLSIAAASIIAKVYRDEIMTKLETQFPAYGFAQHKGYATAQHRAAIAAHGLTEYHRRSFCSAFL